MRRTIADILLSLLLFLVHSTLVKFLSIRDITPDILVVWIVYLSIREGQLVGTVAGFLIGLAVDLMSGSDGMLGLSALAKTVAGFAAGYFYNENKTQQTLGGYPFIIAVAVASLLHNIIYFVIFLQGSPLGLQSIILMYGIPATLYTAAVGFLPMFAFARKYRS